MLYLNIFGWTVSIVYFVLICVGGLLLILAVLGLLLWLCCFCCGRRSRDRGIPTKESYSPATHLLVPPGSTPDVYPQGFYPPGTPPPPAAHMAVPVADAPLTPAPSGPRPAPGSPGGSHSPAAVKKWEEQLQATLFRKMSLEEVRASTGYFNRRYYLGEGAFAVVYRGQGPNGVPWAVKRSKQHLPEGSMGAQDFEKEVIAISRLSHKHLVRLLGYCMEEGEHILVYECCPNGSLSAALYASKPLLSFLQRLDIAIGTAEALYYLHSAASPSIIHRDVKPDNVFLDSQFQAKLGDFGLLKKLLEVNCEDEEEAIQRQKFESVFTRIAGTPGYLDPEYHLTSKVTAKGDVYSFGVLLLQLCTGQRAILPQHPKFNEDSNLKSKSAPNSMASSDVSTGFDVSASLVPPGGAARQPAAGAGKTPASAPGSAANALLSGSIGTTTAFAALDGPSSNPGGNEHAGEAVRGEPIHISTWLGPYVAAKVVEPVADSRFGNNYNKTALYRMLEIGLSCVQPSARKRPTMNTVTRWLHEVREELEREVDEPEGHYSSVFAFDRDALEGAWKGEDAAGNLQEATRNQRSSVSSQREETQQSAAVSSAAPSSVASSVLKGSADGADLARMTEGR